MVDLRGVVRIHISDVGDSRQPFLSAVSWNKFGLNREPLGDYSINTTLFDRWIDFDLDGLRCKNQRSRSLGQRRRKPMSVVLVAMCIDVGVFSGVDNFTWSRFVADDTLSNPVGHVEVGLHINER